MSYPDPKQWLKAETEFDHGPMETWDQEVKDKFYRDLGFLHHFVTSNQKEVMPVIERESVIPKLTSPANVLSGCGATPEHLKIVRRGIAGLREMELNDLPNALEAILAEREELLKDRARLDKIESSATYIEIDGDDYYIGNNNFDTIREFIESKMKGEG